MVQRIHIVLEDDIDGSSADETVKFALDGTNYEIDLSTANATKLRDAMAPFVGHARRVTGGGRGRRAAAASSSSVGGATPAQIREWAAGAGYELSPRGRVPKEVREAYEAAHA